MNKKHLAHAALALGTAIGSLSGSAVGHAASSDVDTIRLRTNSGSMTSTLTWNHTTYNGQHVDDGFHHISTLSLSNFACADVSVAWFDGELPNPRLADSTMVQHICASISGTQTIPFDMSRYNVPPAEKAIVCMTTMPEVDGIAVQTVCATSLPFTDSTVTGI